MAITGLSMSLFVLTHMLGNLLLFVGPEAYNMYSHKLITNPLITVAELGLLLMFLLHVFMAIRLTIENRSARPTRYAMPTNGSKAVSQASKTMIYHGMVLLIFTVYHLVTFKYGTVYETDYNGVMVRDLHRLVVEVFQSPAYVLFYVISMGTLGFHLSHGVQSSFQSLGFRHPRYTSGLKIFSTAYALIVGLGFGAQPVYVYFFVK